MADFLISGYWKDDKTEFQDYLVTDYDGVQEDDDYFYFGINEEEIKEAIELKEETGLEFVITTYKSI
jgi:hypothetical protein